jgi:hypothetical protein
MFLKTGAAADVAAVLFDCVLAQTLSAAQAALEGVLIIKLFVKNKTICCYHMIPSQYVV